MKKKWVASWLAVLLMLTSFGMTSFAAESSGSVSFAISLDRSEIAQGESTALRLNGLNLDDVYSFEAVFVYNPQAVEITGAQPALQGMSPSLLKNDNKVTFAFTKTGNVEGTSGNALLGSLTVKGVSVGQSDLKLDSVKTYNSELSRTDSYTGNSVSLTVRDGSISNGGEDGSGSTVPEDGDDDISPSFDILIHPIDNGEVAEVGAGYNVIATPFRVFSMSGEREIPLDKPTEVAVELSGTSDYRKVGIYVYNKSSGKWDYVGGKVCADRESIVFMSSGNPDEVYAVLEFNRSFEDVGASFWARDMIEVLAARHIVNGVSDTRFAPGGNVTRAEFAAMAVRLLGLPTATYEGGYSDVPTDAWYADVIEAATQAGIFEGDGISMRPLDQITRQEMAVVAMRVYALLKASASEEQITGPAFADNEMISSWASESAAQAQRLGLITGKPGNRFAPKDSTTRAEAATIMYRLLEKNGEL